MKANRSPSLSAWLLAALVTLSGGFADSYSYITRNHVLSHAQTGNVVFFGQRLMAGDLPGAFRYFLSLFVYASGLFLAERFELRFEGKIPWYKAILATEIVLMSIVGFLPQEEGVNNLANILVAFVCGLQVHSFHLLGEYDYASTMCMGNMKKGLEALNQYIETKHKADAIKALAYLAVILIFALGAGTGYLVTNAAGIRAIWVCSGLFLIAMLLPLESSTP